MDKDTERLYTAANNILEKSLMVRALDGGMDPLIPDAITYGVCAAILYTLLSPADQAEVKGMKGTLADRIKALARGRRAAATMVELSAVHLAARCVGHLGKKPEPDAYTAAAFQGMYEGLRDTMPEEVGLAVHECVARFEERYRVDADVMKEAAEAMREKLTASIPAQVLALGVMSSVLARRGVSHESEHYVEVEAARGRFGAGAYIPADSITVDEAEVNAVLDDLSRFMLHYSPLLDDRQREYRVITGMYRRVLATHFDDKGAQRISDALKVLVPKLTEFNEPKYTEETESWRSPTRTTWKN